MAKRLDYNRMLEAVCGRLEALGVKMHLDRPTATDEKLREFIVVEYATGLRANELGGYGSDYDWTSATVGVVVLVRDNVRAGHATDPDTERLGELTGKLLELLPYKDMERKVRLFKPYIMAVNIADGEGFHYTRVNVRVATF